MNSQTNYLLRQINEATKPSRSVIQEDLLTEEAQINIISELVEATQELLAAEDIQLSEDIEDLDDYILVLESIINEADLDSEVVEALADCAIALCESLTSLDSGLLTEDEDEDSLLAGLEGEGAAAAPKTSKEVGPNEDEFADQHEVVKLAPGKTATHAGVVGANANALRSLAKEGKFKAFDTHLKRALEAHGLEHHAGSAEDADEVLTSIADRFRRRRARFDAQDASSQEPSKKTAENPPAKTSPTEMDPEEVEKIRSSKLAAREATQERLDKDRKLRAAHQRYLASKAAADSTSGRKTADQEQGAYEKEVAAVATHGSAPKRSSTKSSDSAEKNARFSPEPKEGEELDFGGSTEPFRRS